MASHKLGQVIVASAIKKQIPKRGFASAALLSPLYEAPDLPSLPKNTGKAGTPSITTLESGLTVVTENGSASSTVTVTFPSASSSNEASYEGGASLANKCLAFKSGSGLSSLVILRNLENDGAKAYSFAGRTGGAGLGYTCAPDKAEGLVPLLATECSFEKWDVKDAVNLANFISDEASGNAQTVLTDQLYAAAYGSESSIGRSFHTKNASPSSVASFRERTYTAKNAVLAATGIPNHDAFVQSVKDGFSSVSTGAEEVVPFAYIGGEARIHSTAQDTAHIALAFPICPSTPLANVMKHALNLVSSPDIAPFCASSLVGLYTASPSAAASTATDQLCSAITQPITDDVVARAKTLAKAEAAFALSSGSQNLAAAMTASVIETGSFDVSLKAYDAIQTKDVAGMLGNALKEKVSLAAIGDISCVPYHASIASRFS